MNNDVPSSFQLLLTEEAHSQNDLEARLQECLGQTSANTKSIKPGRISTIASFAEAQEDWPQEAFIEACRLLVELSSFPTLGSQPHESPAASIKPPTWLQTLLVLSAGIRRPQALRLLAASTLLDLLALLQAVPAHQVIFLKLLFIFNVGGHILIAFLTKSMHNFNADFILGDASWSGASNYSATVDTTAGCFCCPTNYSISISYQATLGRSWFFESCRSSSMRHAAS